MLMGGRFFGDETMKARIAAGLPLSLPRPDDFEQRFVLIGRNACEEHYRVGKKTVDRWLAEGDKIGLITRRAEFVRQQPGFRDRRPRPADFESRYVALGYKDALKHYGASHATIKRWIAECGGNDLLEQRRSNSLTPAEFSAILKRAFPLRGEISFTLARHAAQHLRIRRNGGYTISPGPNGMWWIGTKKITAAELVQRAIEKGFDANLTGGAR